MLKNFKENTFLFLFNLFPRSLFWNKYRPSILKRAGVNVGNNCNIWAPLEFRPTGKLNNITLNDGCFVNAGTRFASQGKITIGKCVAIGPRVCFETVNHFNKETFKREITFQDICVGDFTWIGAGAIILPGVEIGENAIIAAGAVVTKNVRSDTMVGGVPAKIIKDLNDVKI